MMSEADIQDLIQALGSRNATARMRAREQLVALGENAVPALIPLVASPRKQVRWEAAKALSEIGSEKAVPALVPLLEDQDPGIRWLAAKALIAAGRAGILPLVHALTERPDSVYLRQGAHHVLSTLGQFSKDLRQTLATLLHSLSACSPTEAVAQAAGEAQRKLNLWLASHPEDVGAPLSEEAELAGGKFLYSSDGDVVAYQEGQYVFDVDGRWLGFVPSETADVFTPEGKYLASICEDRRLYILPDRPAQALRPAPAPRKMPAIPDLPPPARASDLPFGARDLK